MGGDVGGEEMWALRELLQRALGRMTIGSGEGIAAILHDFIMRASEDDLLTMIELLPVARGIGVNKRNSPFEHFGQSDYFRMLDRINDFLDRIGSKARFGANGRFMREGFADEIPKELEALPGKNELRSDLANLDKEPFALIYFDLDNFKMVNDTKGHKAGDTCLAAVADAVGRAVVQKGKLYRYGGDEFVVVLRNFSATEAFATAERIRLAVIDARPGGDIEVTTSIGVAATDIAGIDRKEIVRAGDVAMYQSKKQSKNRVTLWSSEMI